ncbi:MAG: hypothetical protein LIP04_11155 [Tannerellaceae bacterium]|nr:hypothetical protein [Tannerellaceae bacterium]
MASPTAGLSRKQVLPKPFTYYTIQNEFPECYGIGERGLSPTASITRKAEALQLKGYLLIFDYLMSGVTQQFKHISSLLELSGKLPEPFRPEIEIPDLHKLIDKEKLRQAVIWDPEEKTGQKNRFFDHLDMFYGENSQTYLPDHSPERRARLIRQFPHFNTHRFRSFNLQDTEWKSTPGIKQLVQTLFGNNPEQEMSVSNNFSRYNLTLVTDQTFFEEFYGKYRVRFFPGDDAYRSTPYATEPVPRIPITPGLQKFYKLRDHLNLFWNRILFEGFLKNGMNPDNFRSLWLPDKSGYLLLYKHPGQEEWMNMGFFFEKQRLVETCNHLWAFVEKLNRESFTCYFMEHLLLPEEEERLPSENNRLTILLTGWVEHMYPREHYLPIFRERLPAHLDIHYRWLGVEEMRFLNNITSHGEVHGHITINSIFSDYHKK